jgi:hypothetical protein
MSAKRRKLLLMSAASVLLLAVLIFRGHILIPGLTPVPGSPAETEKNTWVIVWINGIECPPLARLINQVSPTAKRQPNPGPTGDFGTEFFHDFRL